MTRRAGRQTHSAASRDQRTGAAVLTVRHVRRDLDEDQWDRVVALWRDGEDPAGPDGPAGASALRDAVLRASAELVLVADGPRLLGFAGVVPAAGEVRELRIRPGAHEDVVRALLLGSAAASTRTPAGGVLVPQAAA